MLDILEEDIKSIYNFELSISEPRKINDNYLFDIKVSAIANKNLTNIKDYVLNTLKNIKVKTSIKSNVSKFFFNTIKNSENIQTYRFGKHNLRSQKSCDLLFEFADNIDRQTEYFDVKPSFNKTNGAQFNPANYGVRVLEYHSTVTRYHTGSGVGTRSGQWQTRIKFLKEGKVAAVFVYSDNLTLKELDELKKFTVHYSNKPQYLWHHEGYSSFR
ncbi:MAG: hypothetical protein K8R41_11840 [Bacteroidales bacterium]|nr:hypothetical protein [Bacteroidales bacterium]